MSENTPPPVPGRPGLRPWKKGETANPGGRPRSEVGFRARCRAIAAEMLERLADPELDPAHVPGLVRAFEAICDRGGYIAADKDHRILLGWLSLNPQVTDAQREVARTYLSSWGRDDDAPALGATEDE